MKRSRHAAIVGAAPNRGAMAFYAALWLPTALYVLILRRHSEIDIGPVLAGYLGVFLLGFLFLAVGTFCSTLTDNQLIAAIIAFAAMVALFSIGLVERGHPVAGGMTRQQPPAGKL